MTAKLAIYQQFILRMCDADKRATHAPTRIAAMTYRVRETAAVYAANAEAIEAAIQDKRTTNQEGVSYGQNL